MDFSSLRSPGNISQVKLMKGVFTIIAVIVVFVLFSFITSSRSQTFGLSGAGVAMAPAMPNYMGGGYPAPTSRVSQKGMAYAEDSARDEMYPSPIVPPYGNTAGSPDFPAERKVIRNGSLSLVVNEVAKSAKDIADIATRMGGWVDNQNLQEYSLGSLQGSLTLRIPEPKFMETLTQVKLLAVRVQNEQIGSEDVSAQVVDLEARLKNKRAEEASYVVIMRDAKKISDVLEVTRMLSSVRGEIEQMQGQINYLARQTSMSTIHISLTPVANAKEVTNEWKPSLIVKQAVKNLVIGLTGFASGIIVFAIQVLPMLILNIALIALVCVIVWKLGKKLFYRLGGRALPPKQG